MHRNMHYFFSLQHTPRGYIIDVERRDSMDCCQMKKKNRTEDEKKELITRINRIMGSLNGIKNMIEEDRYCDDVLIQLSAVDKSIKSLANVILDNHMHTCLIEHIEKKDYQIIDEIIDLFRRFQ